ncbi:MAG TPA: branched-chain amino acid ABC transporter permease [Microbacteriaceae bacterium]|nr:branched-chain amino acid ABC transporter permease [Microbacteriaceae bacterium]
MEPLVLFLLSVFSAFGFYALLAWGLGLIFGQLGVVNVAHGDMAMIGAFIMFAFPEVPFVLRLLIAIVAGLLLGVIIERLLLSGLYRHGMLATLLAMWGAAIVMRQSMEAVFGPTPRTVAPVVTGTVEVLGVNYPTYRLVSAAVSLLIVAVLIVVMYRTSLGLRLRASIDNRSMAAGFGIPTGAMITGTFAVGTALAVLAGALQSPMLGVTPQVGLSFLAPTFFAVLLGRPGSLGGPIFGAFVVAVLDIGLRTILPETVAGVLFFIALIVLIALQPQGPNWRFTAWKPLQRRAA